jgi:hypothetical protein
MMVAASEGGTLLKIAVADGAILESWEGRRREGPICISPDGRLVARGSEDGIRIRRLGEGLSAGIQLVPVDGEVSSLAWSASGRVLVAGTDRGEVFVFGARGVGELLRAPDPRSGALPGPAIARPPERKQESGPSLLAPFATKEQRPPVRAKIGLVILDQMHGDPRTTARLERSLVSNLGKLEGCWKREGRQGRVVDGRVSLRLTISPDGEGRAFDDPLLDTLGNPRLLDCLVDRLRSPLFGPGLGSLEVELNLTLEEVEAP